MRLRLGALPQGVGEGQVLGGAALSGIGFTVSLLIADLAFDSEVLRDEATVGVLLAAVLAVSTGWIVFWLAACCAASATATPAAVPRPRRSTRRATTSAARPTRR